jgi:hypothetical protein
LSWKESKTQLTVYNMEGRMITQLLDKVMRAGKHSITWQPKNLTAGYVSPAIPGG